VLPDETELHVPVIKKEKSKKMGSKSIVKKKPSSTSVKKSPKLKMGESKIPLSMEDLYLKKNLFNIPNVDTNVESSAEGSKEVDVEMSKVDDARASEETFATAHTTKTSEKGNSDEILKSAGANSAENLGLDAKIHDENNACVDVNSAIDTGLTSKSLISETVKIFVEKKDVGPDVETSLGQQEIQVDTTAEVGKSNHEVHVSENKINSGNTAVIPPTNEEKETSTKTQEVAEASDGDDTVEKVDDDVIC
jgi:hypothetical protein